METLEVASQSIVGYYDLSCGEMVDDFLRLPNHGKKQSSWPVGPQHTGEADRWRGGLRTGSQAQH